MTDTDTQTEELDDSALENWKRDALERRSTRRRKGIRAALDAFGAWPRWKRVVVGVPSVLLALVVVGGVVDGVASVGRIHPGVHAAGIAVGGMTRDKAATVISRELDGRFDEPVRVSYDNANWDIKATQIGAVADVDRATANAFAVGREGGPLSAIADRMTAWFKPVDVEVPVSSDASLTAGVLDGIATSIDKAPVDASIVIEGTEPRIEPSEPGVAVERTSLERDLLSALVSESRRVEVRVASVPVQVTEEGARAALDEVTRMLAGPVEIVHEEQTWQFSVTEIAEWIAFRPVSAEPTSSGEASGQVEATSASAPQVAPGSLVLEAFIDASEASETITPHVGEAGRPAVDASFRVSSGSVSIVPSQDGVGPDVEALAKELTVVLKSSEVRRVELRTQRVEPELTTEDAKAMGIKERISSYTTTYDAGNKPRVNNIHTLADAIDGTLIGPGETFSFNGTVGPRTAAKGYQEAPAIVNGKLVPQLGGGICQVGTTLFNTVFESGLPVVERTNHSFYISHYPKGRDATVSWGGPDFKFKNDTTHWVLLATGYSSSSLTISLYGTDPGYEVEASTGAWTGMKPHPVKETPDLTLELGKRVIEDSGVDGRTIVVKRIVRRNGTIVREDSFKSVYKPKEEVVRVGSMPPAGQAPTSTVATP